MITQAQAKEAIATVKDPAFDADIISYRISATSKCKVTMFSFASTFRRMPIR